MRDFIGQRRLLERLDERTLKGELGHAYVLSGPRGVGKRLLAVRLAQTLACPAGKAGGCGTCSACTRVESWGHPDVELFTRLVERRDSKGDRMDQAKNISIEQMRELQLNLSLRPLEMKRRVVVIDDAADLSEPAQVALLKTLEEPPKHVLMLLVTPTPSALMQTVLSRAQVLTLHPVPADEIAAGLTALHGKDAAKHAAGAGGRPGLAITLATDATERQHRTDLDLEFYKLVGNGATYRFAWAADLSDDHDTQRRARAIDERFAHWTELLRDAAVAGAGGTSMLRADRASESRTLGAARPAREIVDAALLMGRMHEDLEVNANARAMLELLALRLPHAPALANAR